MVHYTSIFPLPHASIIQVFSIYLLRAHCAISILLEAGDKTRNGTYSVFRTLRYAKSYQTEVLASLRVLVAHLTHREWLGRDSWGTESFSSELKDVSPS